MAARLRRAPGRHRAGRAPAPALPGRSHRPAPSPPPATVVVRAEVLRTIGRACAGSGGRETGGPLIGIFQPSWAGTRPGLLVQVLGTVPPGPGGQAGPAWVGLGRGGDGERAATALRWWRAVTGLDLRHLGDWHKHHSGRPGPSAGDRVTATKMWADSGMPIWLTAVVVGRRQTDAGIEARGHLVRVSVQARGAEEIAFYRPIAGGRVQPLAVRPEAAAIPGLPPLPWHVTDPSRFAVECRLLQAMGYRVSVDPRRPDGGLGLALRLSRDGRPPLTVVTGLGHPAEPPAVLDARGRLRPVQGWAPTLFLADLVPKAAS